MSIEKELKNEKKSKKNSPTTLGRRLRELRGTRSQQQMADMFSVTQGTWGKWEAGMVPGADIVFEIATRFGVTVESLMSSAEGDYMFDPLEHIKQQAKYWIASDTDGMEVGKDLPENYSKVPLYDISASAGGGALVQSEQVVDYLAFKIDYLRTHLGMTPSAAAVISVIGDSMEPYLSDGDLILIDTNVMRIENDSIYVLQSGDALQVKRIQRKVDGTVIVKSDNPQYDPEIFRNDAAAQLRVVGRLVRRLVK